MDLDVEPVTDQPISFFWFFWFVCSLCIVQLQLFQSRHFFTMLGCFECFPIPPNPDVDCKILNMHTQSSCMQVCICTQGTLVYSLIQRSFLSPLPSSTTQRKTSTIMRLPGEAGIQIFCETDRIPDCEIWRGKNPVRLIFFPTGSMED